MAADKQESRMRGLLLGAGLAVTLAGCATTSIPGTPQTGISAAAVPVPGVAGFLYTDSSNVIYLQWPTDMAPTMAGTIKDDHVTGQAPHEQVTDETTSFTGQIEPGGSVAFDFHNGWGTVYGTKTGTTVTLNLPEQGGGLQAITFRPATPDDYNTAVAALGSAADHVNQDTQHQQQISRDAGALSDAVAHLPSDTQGLSSDLTTLGNSVTGTNQDTATTRSAASASEHPGEAASGCGDVAGAGGDAAGVGGDASSVGGDLQELTHDVGAVRQDITTVTNDLSQVQQDAPGYHGGASASGPADVQNAINAANTAITHTISIANGDIDETNADVAAAYGAVASAARTTGCQGADGGPPPAPIAHIS